MGDDSQPDQTIYQTGGGLQTGTLETGTLHTGDLNAPVQSAQPQQAAPDTNGQGADTGGVGAGIPGADSFEQGFIGNVGSLSATDEELQTLHGINDTLQNYLLNGGSHNQPAPPTPEQQRAQQWQQARMQGRIYAKPLVDRDISGNDVTNAPRDLMGGQVLQSQAHLTPQSTWDQIFRNTATNNFGAGEETNPSYQGMGTQSSVDVTPGQAAINARFAPQAQAMFGKSYAELTPDQRRAVLSGGASGTPAGATDWKNSAGMGISSSKGWGFARNVSPSESYDTLTTPTGVTDTVVPKPTPFTLAATRPALPTTALGMPVVNPTTAVSAAPTAALPPSKPATAAVAPLSLPAPTAPVSSQPAAPDQTPYGSDWQLGQYNPYTSWSGPGLAMHGALQSAASNLYAPIRWGGRFLRRARTGAGEIASLFSDQPYPVNLPPSKLAATR